MRFQKITDFTPFEGIIYDESKSQEYYTFWQDMLNGVDLTEELKTELAKGWQYISIYYVNNKERMEKDYYTYTENLYWIVYEFVKKYNKHNLDWEYVGPKLLEFCPNRRDLLGMYWVNRHEANFSRMQEQKVQDIVNNTINYLNKIEERQLRKQ